MFTFDKHKEMPNETLAIVTFDAAVVISSAENPFGDGICPTGSAEPTQGLWNVPSCTIREYKGSWLIKKTVLPEVTEHYTREEVFSAMRIIGKAFNRYVYVWEIHLMKCFQEWSKIFKLTFILYDHRKPNGKQQHINPFGNLINLFGISIYAGFKIQIQSVDMDYATVYATEV